MKRIDIDTHDNYNMCISLWIAKQKIEITTYAEAISLQSFFEAFLTKKLIVGEAYNLTSTRLKGECRGDHVLLFLGSTSEKYYQVDAIQIINAIKIIYTHWRKKPPQSYQTKCKREGKYRAWRRQDEAKKATSA